MVTAKTFSLSKMVVMYQGDRLLLVLVGMFLFPVVFHSLPGASANIGAQWVPIFYAPLLAVLGCRLHVGMLAAFISPMLNMLLVGRPEGSMLNILTVDLMLFVGFSWCSLRIMKRIPLVGVASYVVAKFVSIIILGMLPIRGILNSRWDVFLNTLYQAIPGLLVLTFINAVFVYFKKNNG